MTACLTLAMAATGADHIGGGYYTAGWRRWRQVILQCGAFCALCVLLFSNTFCDNSISLQSALPAALRTTNERPKAMALASQPQRAASSQVFIARSLHRPQAARPAGRAPARHGSSCSRRLQAAQGSSEPASSMGQPADHQGSGDGSPAAAAAEAAPPVKLPPPPPPALTPQQRQRQRLRDILTFCLPVVLVPLADPVSDNAPGRIGASAECCLPALSAARPPSSLVHPTYLLPCLPTCRSCL